jgi:serine/threonine protein kinase
MSADAAAAPVLNEPGPAQGRGREADERADGGSDMALRNQVFISYAHADAAWKDAFVTMLDPAIKRGNISLWSDGSIPVGEDWSRQIDDALNSAAAGLLLVTPAFLDSDFVNTVELPRLLNLAKTSGVGIWWVPVSASLYTATALSEVQAAWDPKNPLDSLTPAERNSAIQKICRQLVEDVGFLPKVTGRRRGNLSSELQTRLGERYQVGEEEGAGRYSIVYKATQTNPARDVAVKLFVASEFDVWATQAFETAVAQGAELRSAAFIGIIEHSMETPEFLITEFVQGETLSKFLHRYPSGMPLGLVRRILQNLVTAFEEIHAAGHIRGELCPSNILIEPDGTPRISTVDVSTVLSRESQLAGDFRVDRELLAYMTPERYFGQPPTKLTDQFSLGLIAVELLGGEKLPRVSCPKDFEDKRGLFARLERGEGPWAQRSSDFAGLVSRMLKTDPEDRWSSMSDVAEWLSDIEIAETEEERAKRTAQGVYLRLQKGNKPREFFERFYENLFATSPGVQALFRPGSMDKQKEMLNRAVELLLKFDPACGCPELRRLAGSHVRYQLTKEHYDLFLDVLVRTMEQIGVADAAESAAWRTAINPAIEFMRTCQGDSQQFHREDPDGDDAHRKCSVPTSADGGHTDR